MVKKERNIISMTSKSPRKWVEDHLDTKSPTICGAKWFNSTIWLGNGMSASCHHPPPHKIDPDEVKENFRALHNTSYKKMVRKEMQEGKQTRECEYCWKIENLKKDLVSDRYYKSVCYNTSDLDEAFDTSWEADIIPKQLEIAFDNNCNFGCSYCNAGFSTTWSHDINKNGAYQDLNSDGAAAYAHNGKWAMPYGAKNEDNPFIEAFWKWWNAELQYHLTELRVTGGEPTMSKDFWKLVKWFKDNQDSPAINMDFSFNSNLGIKQSRINEICELSHILPNLGVFTSNEAVGAHAEYIRDGLEWDQWSRNLEYLAANSNLKKIHVMLTLNALSLSSLDKLLEFVIELREKYKNISIDTSYNILRFPSFQSITSLPAHIKEERHTYYSRWLDANRHRLLDYELPGIERLITYIKEVDEGHSVRSYSDLLTRQHDFYNFYCQYDKRRDKNFTSTFSDWPELVDWFESMSDNDNRKSVDTLVTGDATLWGADIFEEVIRNNVQQKS
jgi:organic radical activating enzyme